MGELNPASSNQPQSGMIVLNLADLLCMWGPTNRQLQSRLDWAVSTEFISNGLLHTVLSCFYIMMSREAPSESSSIASKNLDSTGIPFHYF